MQLIKKNARNLTERFIGSSFAQKSVMAAIALVISTSNVMAGSKGAAGFTKATQEVSSYQTPVSNLMKAIAAVIVLVGAFNVYLWGIERSVFFNGWEKWAKGFENQRV